MSQCDNRLNSPAFRRSVGEHDHAPLNSIAGRASWCLAVLNPLAEVAKCMVIHADEVDEVTLLLRLNRTRVMVRVVMEPQPVGFFVSERIRYLLSAPICQQGRDTASRTLLTAMALPVILPEKLAPQ